MAIGNFFNPLRTDNPELTRVQDAIKRAFAFTADAVDKAIAAAQAAASTAVWSTVSVPFHNDMRKLPGDKDGKTGPRAIIVAGGAGYFDGGQGVYAWDPASTALDNDTTVIGKFSAQGRWRKV
jgi:hypothetical protein